jgi:hypothetical protein
MKNIKQNTVIMAICLFTIGLGISFFTAPPVYGSPSIEKKIKNHPAVSNVKVIMDDGAFGRDLTILIEFKDGCDIVVEKVDGKGRGARGGRRAIVIDKVDGYYFPINTPSPAESRMRFWSAITGVQMENIMDVVENHSAIRQAVSEWPILDDHANYDGERHDDIKKKLIEENKMPFIIFEGKKYWLYRWLPYKN